MEFKLFRGRSVGAAQVRGFRRRAGAGGARLSELTAHGRGPAGLRVVLQAQDGVITSSCIRKNDLGCRPGPCTWQQNDTRFYPATMCMLQKCPRQCLCLRNDSSPVLYLIRRQGAATGPGAKIMVRKASALRRAKFMVRIHQHACMLDNDSISTSKTLENFFKLFFRSAGLRRASALCRAVVDLLTICVCWSSGSSCIGTGRASALRRLYERTQITWGVWTLAADVRFFGWK